MAGWKIKSGLQSESCDASLGARPRRPATLPPKVLVRSAKKHDPACPAWLTDARRGTDTLWKRLRLVGVARLKEALACHPPLVVARHFLHGGVVEAFAVLGRGLT